MVDIEIIHVNKHSELMHVLENGSLWKLYNDCFNGPPYEETFSRKDVSDLFESYYSKGVVLLCYDIKNDILVGFSAALPLEYEPEIRNLMRSKGYAVEKVWYYADIGVAYDYRRKGIAEVMAEHIKKSVPPGTRALLMRTQENNIASKNCHLKVGYKQINNMLQDMQRTTKNGTPIIDRRIFLVYPFIDGWEHKDERDDAAFRNDSKGQYAGKWISVHSMH